MRIRGIAAALALLPSLAGAGESDADRAFRSDVGALVSSYCVKCHGAEKPKAGIDLSAVADASSVARSRKTWGRVRDAIESGAMPPDDAPQPPGDRAERAVHWLQSALSKVDCKIIDDPGRVTLRRLNRAEYRNTVRDLLLVDYAPNRRLPVRRRAGCSTKMRRQFHQDRRSTSPMLAGRRRI